MKHCGRQLQEASALLHLGIISPIPVFHLGHPPLWRAIPFGKTVLFNAVCFFTTFSSAVSLEAEGKYEMNIGGRQCGRPSARSKKCLISHSHRHTYRSSLDFAAHQVAGM